MGRKIIFLAFSFLLFFGSILYADTIHLKNGNKVSGIITYENDDTVAIKINIGAVVTFFKSDIEKIDRDSEQHAEIENTWQQERAERESAIDVQSSYEEKQEEKGLVKYKGKWVTPEEKERLQVVSIAEDIEKGHSEIRYSSGKDRVDRSDFAEKLLKKGNWFNKETENFSIFYRDLSQAKIVSDKAEYYFEKIAYDLGYEDKVKWNKKCQVYIVENADKWRSFLKDVGFNADLVGGFVPNYGDKEMYLCALSDTYLAITFPHELTHLIFRDIAGDSTIPIWLNEGLANYEARVTSISNELLIKHIKNGSHILLGDLLRIAHYPEGKEMRELFYAQSEKIVEFLITQFGRKKFRRFCNLILSDKSFSDSLFKAYRGDFKDIEDFNIKLVEYIVK